MTNKLAFALLALSFNAFADSAHVVPGSAGLPAMQHDTSHIYQCASDGHSLFANVAAGFSRCQAVFPLDVPANAPVGVITAQAGYFSKDMTSNLKLSVYKRGGPDGLELIATESDFQPAPMRSETLTAIFNELVYPGQYLYAVVEVEGDTQIRSVGFETLD